MEKNEAGLKTLQDRVRDARMAIAGHSERLIDDEKTLGILADSLEGIVSKLEAVVPKKAKKKVTKKAAKKKRATKKAGS